MHIVAFLRKGIQDVPLAAIWQKHNLQVFPLSSWYSQSQKRYGLVLGYTNIRSQAYAYAVMLLEKPLRETFMLINSAT